MGPPAFAVPRIDRPFARRARFGRRVGLPSESADRPLGQARGFHRVRRRGARASSSARSSATRKRRGTPRAAVVRRARRRPAIRPSHARRSEGLHVRRRRDAGHRDWRQYRRVQRARRGALPHAACESAAGAARAGVGRSRGFKGWSISYDGSMRPYPGGRRIAYSFSYPMYVALRDRTNSFSDLFLFSDQSLTVGMAGRDERATTLVVSGNFAGALGVGTSLGRPLSPEDDRPGAPPVAVLTNVGWQRLFGSDPGAVGQTITINGAPAVIVGVTPPSFFGLEPGWPVDMLAPVVPMMPVIERGREVLGNPKYWAFRVMGRVRPDVADARIQTELEALMHQALPAELLAPDPAQRPRVVVNPGGQGLDSLRRNYSEPLYLLLAIMAGVLLIACANIAGLLLTRNAARGRELAVRLALGAGRGRIVRQLLTESLLLASIGGAIGLGLALAVRSQLLPLLNQDDPPIVLPLGFGPALWLFAGGLSLVVALLFGALPAWRATRIGQDTGPDANRPVLRLNVTLVRGQDAHRTAGRAVARARRRRRLVPAHAAEPAIRSPRLSPGPSPDVSGRSHLERIRGQPAARFLRARARSPRRRYLASPRCRLRGRAC